MPYFREKKILVGIDQDTYRLLGEAAASKNLQYATQDYWVRSVIGMPIPPAQQNQVGKKVLLWVGQDTYDRLRELQHGLGTKSINDTLHKFLGLPPTTPGRHT
jgi:hypothetical protein